MYRIQIALLMSVTCFLTACNMGDPKEQAERGVDAATEDSEAPSNETERGSEAFSSADNYQAHYPLNAFNDAFETRFSWENRGRERMVSDGYRSGSIWVPSKVAGGGLTVDLIQSLLPELNNGEFAEAAVSGCNELIMIHQTFLEESTFTTATVRCGLHHGIMTSLESDDYHQVWLVTGRDSPLTREQALQRSMRLALALEDRIWDEF